MKIEFCEIPDDKEVNDYSDDTIFVLEDKFPSLFDQPQTKKSKPQGK